MKQLTCEMCGGTDLIKDGGVFVCQTCGCKYSVEEAKKMMIEGTVEVQGTVQAVSYTHLIDCEVVTPKEWTRFFEKSTSPLMEINCTIYFKNIQVIDINLEKKLRDMIENTNLCKMCIRDRSGAVRVEVIGGQMKVQEFIGRAAEEEN